MRLGTLARKISITPSKLTAYLESQAIDLSSGTNTKLTDEQIQLVLDHFDASLEPQSEGTNESTVDQLGNDETDKTTEEKVIDEEVEAAPQPTSEIEPESEPGEIEEKEIEPTSPVISDSFAEIALPHELEDELNPESSSQSDEAPTESEEKDDKDKETEAPKTKSPIAIDPEIESEAERAAYDDSIEVIKPPKVKLPGLKVKGKIDLPEPKVPDEKTEEAPKPEEKVAYDPNEIITTTGPKRERRRKPKNYKGKKYNKDYNPVEAARRKKEWEEKKQKEQEERRRKKAKARHYKQHVSQATQPTASKKKSKRATASQKQEQKTGNFLQRFWRWMNT